MTANLIGYEVSCDGPAQSVGCPDSAAVSASITSLTATEVRADGREQGWVRRRRDGQLGDLCPACKTTERTSP